MTNTTDSVTVPAGRVAGQQVDESFREAHSAASHDLWSVSWIPVVCSLGTSEFIGLGQLFAECHEIRDLSEPDPLIRAALRRYLSALAVRLVHLSESQSSVQWTKRLALGQGFTAQEIAMLHADQQAYLYLFHPATPFLQDSRYLESTRAFSPNWLTTSDELVTPLPGSTSRAWAFKPGDPGVSAGLAWDSAARALVARWFYGLSGNGGGGDMGGAFPNGTADAPMTHAFRLHPSSLFGTLMRNVNRFVMTGQPSPIEGPAWMDRHRPSFGGDGLYLYTTTATSTLVGPLGSDRLIREVLRGTIDDPAGSKESRKAAKQAARDNDPHRIQRTPDSRGKPRSDVRLTASEPPLRRLAQLRRGIVDESGVTATGVVDGSSLWLSGAEGRHDETIELTLANLAGAATSPQWAATITVSLPAAHLDPQWERSGDVDVLIDVGFSDKGVYQTIRSAIGLVFRGQEDPKKSTVGSALVAAARQRWLADAEVVTNAALAGTVTVDEATAAFWRLGRIAVREVLEPYSSTTRYAGRVVQAIAAVRSRA